MSVFEAFFQGLIQGLTEFLPVSSSGHLSLFQYFTGNNSETGFVFSILLHAGTLIAVCIVFWRTIVSLIAEAFSLIGDLFFTPLLHTRYASRAAYASVFAVVCLPIVFDGAHQGSHLRVFHRQ